MLLLFFLSTACMGVALGYPRRVSCAAESMQHAKSTISVNHLSWKHVSMKRFETVSPSIYMQYLRWHIIIMSNNLYNQLGMFEKG